MHDIRFYEDYNNTRVRVCDYKFTQYKIDFAAYIGNSYSSRQLIFITLYNWFFHFICHLHETDSSMHFSRFMTAEIYCTRTYLQVNYYY